MTYSIFSVMLFSALSVLMIYMAIDFFGYLKKFHSAKWKEISFERPFGISQDKLCFYPIRPIKFIPFLFSKNDIDDSNVTIYKTVIKLTLLAIIFFIIFSFFIV